MIICLIFFFSWALSKRLRAIGRAEEGVNKRRTIRRRLPREHERISLCRGDHPP